MIGIIERLRERMVRNVAQRTMRKYGPGVIAIAGEEGKPIVREAVRAVLENVRSIRTGSARFGRNAVPLAIISDESYGSGALFWIRTIAKAWWALVMRREYPELLILECAGKSHEDALRFLEFVSPQIVIVVASGDAASYGASPLVEALPSNGYGIIDCDGKGMKILGERTRAHVMPFGFADNAGMRIANFAERQDGVSFALEYAGKAVPVTIGGMRGKGVASACAAAACVGIAFGLNLPRIIGFLRYCRPPEGVLPKQNI
jgi:UDP-N-acetylmuramyl pentapeptide synthase